MPWETGRGKQGLLSAPRKSVEAPRRLMKRRDLSDVKTLKGCGLTVGVSGERRGATRVHCTPGLDRRKKGMDEA